MRNTDEMLERLRRVADPLADQAIAALGGHQPVGALIPRLVAVPRPACSQLPASVEAWLAEHARLPDWVDQERIDRASALWVKRGVTMAMILGTASLAECYAAARGVKAITYSNRLKYDTFRRLRETVLWVNLLMLPGGLADGGEGVRAVYKVRLMHAAIRWLISASNGWDAERRGLPLCQEDLAGTLLTFAYTVPRSLRRLGVPLSDQEAEDYLYFWAVVGEMMGVRPELLPVNMAEAEELAGLIFRRQHAPSAEGQAMTRAMLETYGNLLPGGVLRGFFPAFIRFLSGDRVADLLGVPASRRVEAMRYYRLIGSVADFGWRAWTVMRYAFHGPRRRTAVSQESHAD